jgi:hypothetical protein
MIGAAGISGRARRQKRSRLHCAIDPLFGFMSDLDAALASGWMPSGTS